MPFDLGPGRACPDQYGSVVTERPFHDIVIVAGSEHRKIDNFLAVADRVVHHGDSQITPDIGAPPCISCYHHRDGFRRGARELCSGSSV